MIVYEFRSEVEKVSVVGSEAVFHFFCRKMPRKSRSSAIWRRCVAEVAALLKVALVGL